jgi:hypothetical protein
MSNRTLKRISHQNTEPREQVGKRIVETKDQN